jgi:hypothetical protein
LNTCKRIRCTVDKAPKILRKRRNRHGG